MAGQIENWMDRKVPMNAIMEACAWDDNEASLVANVWGISSLFRRPILKRLIVEIERT